MIKLRDAIALAVVAIMLACLWLPGMLRSRDDSRRSHCSENLRRMAVALDSYTQQHGMLPPTAAGEDINDIFGLTAKEVWLVNWAQLLLEHLGEHELAARFDSRVPLSDKRNDAARTSRCTALNCPADTFNTPENDYRRELPSGRTARYARGNYAINAGTNTQCYFPGDLERPCINGFHTAWSPRYHAWGNGVAGFNKSFTRASFTGGLDKMVAIEEVRAGIHHVDSRGVWCLGQIGASSTFGHGIWGDDTGPNAQHRHADDIVGCKELHEAIGPTGIEQESMPCFAHSANAEQATARSMHPGGVHVLMLDGSSRFVANTIEPNVWHALHSSDVMGKPAVPKE